jgi:hypothetical protein
VGIVATATVDCFVPSARAGVLAGRGAAVIHWEGVKVSRFIRLMKTFSPASNNEIE